MSDWAASGREEDQKLGGRRAMWNKRCVRPQLFFFFFATTHKDEVRRDRGHVWIFMLLTSMTARCGSQMRHWVRKRELVKGS